MCVNGIDFFTIFQLDFETVMTEGYIFFFLLYYNIYFW